MNDNNQSPDLNNAQNLEPMAPPEPPSQEVQNFNTTPEPQATTEAPASEPGLEISPETPTPEDNTKPAKKKKLTIILLIVFLVLLVGSVVVYLVFGSGIKANQTHLGYDEKDQESAPERVDLTLDGNDLDDFDLSFLKLENINNEEEENIVYSPLSIKYALSMLSAGAAGETKDQIDSILGSYHFKTYENSANLSLANAIFVNSANQDAIKSAYIDALKDNYSAEVLFDSFATPDLLNSWIENKTLGLIKNALSDSDPNMLFYLVNALAIDMEWANKIQTPEGGTPFSDFHNENYSYNVKFLYEDVRSVWAEYFNETWMDYEDFGAVANKYDIIKELGEENIRSTVQNNYEEWAKERREELSSGIGVCENEAEIAAQAPNLDEYIETLKKHYGHISSSTDFSWYDDENISAFAKDLKTYGDTTLQYIAISPKENDVKKYIEKTSASDLKNIIKNLKGLDWDSYEDGYVTTIDGATSNFNFDYRLKLQDDLETIGISNIFDSEKADLSGIGDGVYIDTALHAANIAFSNNGIKAGAVTLAGGKGGGGPDCSYYYAFEVPKKDINLSFHRNFLFLIRDKDSGEIWFVGANY